MNELVYKNRVSGFLTAFEPVKVNALSNTTFTPHNGFVYTKTLSAGETFTFNTPEEAICTCELWLVQPATAVSFGFATNVWWESDGDYSSTNQPPDFSTGNTAYCVVIRWDRYRWIGTLAYSTPAFPAPFRALSYIGYVDSTKASNSLIRLAQKFSDCTKIEFAMRSSSTSNEDVLLGDAHESSGYLGFMNGSNLVLASPLSGAWHSVTLSLVPASWNVTAKGSGAFQKVVMSYTWDADTPQAGISFGGYGTVTGQYSKQKFLQSVKLYSGSTLLADYESALCSAGGTYTDGNTGSTVTAVANKPGLYDRVSGKFFVNQITGADAVEFLYA